MRRLQILLTVAQEDRMGDLSMEAPAACVLATRLNCEVPHWARILVFSPDESCPAARWQGEALGWPRGACIEPYVLAPPLGRSDTDSGLSAICHLSDLRSGLLARTWLHLPMQSSMQDDANGQASEYV